MDDITYLQHVLDATSIGIIALKAMRDEAGQIIDFIFTLANRQSVINISYSKTDLIGKRLLAVAPNIKTIGLFDNYVRVVETGEPFATELFYEQADFQAWFALNAIRLNDGLVISFQDITARKQIEAQAKERERLIHQFRSEHEHGLLVYTLLSRLVTDIRTPISIIRLSKDVLLNYYDHLSEDKRREKLERIGEQLDLAFALLDNTLASVRRMLDERPFQPRLVNLHQLCAVCIEQIEQMYGISQQIRLVNSQHIDYVMVDDVLISRILLNLLSNAIKYSPANQPIFLELAHYPDDQQLVLRVIDMGIGIPPEHLPHIFEPFYRVRHDDPMRGAGLGLSIVKECVARHGGTIDISSTLHSGTVVIVRLPYVAG